MQYRNFTPDNRVVVKVAPTLKTKPTYVASDLSGGTLSADRIKADYDMIANRAFLAYGKTKGNEK